MKISFDETEITALLEQAGLKVLKSRNVRKNLGRRATLVLTMALNEELLRRAEQPDAPPDQP
jgi:hypothetical protein